MSIILSLLIHSLARVSRRDKWCGRWISVNARREECVSTLNAWAARAQSLVNKQPTQIEHHFLSFSPFFLVRNDPVQTTWYRQNCLPFAALLLIFQSHLPDWCIVNHAPVLLPHHYVPLQQFHFLLTILPNFFSFFARATCPLSVFVGYLDFSGDYLKLYVPLIRNATLWRGVICSKAPRLRDFHPLWWEFPFHFAKTSRHPSPPQVNRWMPINSAPTLYPRSLGSSFATTGPITFVFFSSSE